MSRTARTNFTRAPETLAIRLLGNVLVGPQTPPAIPHALPISPLISKMTLYSPPAFHRPYHPHFALSCPHLPGPFPHCRSSIGIPNIHHPPRRLLYTSRSTLPSFQGNVALDVARMLLAPPDILAQTTTSLPPCWTSHIVLPFATYLY